MRSARKELDRRFSVLVPQTNSWQTYPWSMVVLRPKLGWKCKLTRLALDVEQAACGDIAARVGALFAGRLQQRGVPTRHEVAVVAESGEITVGQHERPRAVGKHRRLPRYLVQKRGESPGIAVGTNTVLHQARKRHVAAVVARVSMQAIPTRVEHQLQTQSDRAGPV